MATTEAPAVVAFAEAASDPAARPRTRYVPAAIRRAVWKRDGGHCVWPLEGGGVCGSTLRVELDHVDGFALGGATSVERCRLLCRVHQEVHARQVYGDELMNRFTSRGGTDVAARGGRKGPRVSEPMVGYASAYA